ncbi:MAG: hypothetical protein N2201_07270, partial [candidate division WOR-3 bacterium]|nr:hypothetical protein [candidate division WOR-3 bacterium]
MLKKVLISIVLILVVCVYWAIAEDDKEFDTDGVKSLELVRDGRTLNAIFPYQGTDGRAWFWIVGDSGLVLRYREAREMNRSVLNINHNLMSISFAQNIGWIVGYINSGDSTWKGVIYRSQNNGPWERVPDENILGLPDRFIPFLKVQAIDNGNAWISCGNGEVLRTWNGGIQWWRCNKPGGETNFSWFYGLYAIDNNTAWVASDQTGLVAKTMNGGNNWLCFYPGDGDLVYFDIHPGSDNQTVYLTASKGKKVYTQSGGAHWIIEPIDDRVGSYQWWKACARRGNTYQGEPNLFVGTGTVRKWPFLGYTITSYPYFDFNDIAYIKDAWDNEWCAAVGTPRLTFTGPRRTARFWLNKAKPPDFQITDVNAVNGDNSVKIKVTVKNNTNNNFSGYLNINIWQSPLKSGGAEDDLYECVLSIPVHYSINAANSAIREIDYQPQDSFKYWYGATLPDYDEEEGVRCSPEVDWAIALSQPTAQGPPPPYYLNIYDKPNDHGTQVYLTWQHYPGGYSFLICKQLDDESVYVYPYWRRASAHRGEFFYKHNARPPCYLNICTGIPNNYWVWTYNDNTRKPSEESSDEISGTAIDNLRPQAGPTNVTLFMPNPTTVNLRWVPIARENEPNLGGYEVKMEKYGCPEDKLRQQTAPIISTMRTFRVHPLMVGYPGIWKVRAVDRSGNVGPWSEPAQLYIPPNIYVPGQYGNYSTAFTQGRHLVRPPNSKEIYKTFVYEGKIYLSRTTDEGENWEIEEIDNGLYPCLGVNYTGKPWIAYINNDGDIVCKIKRTDGSW